MQPRLATTVNGSVLGTVKIQAFTGPSGIWRPQGKELTEHTLHVYGCPHSQFEDVLIFYHSFPTDKAVLYGES